MVEKTTTSEVVKCDECGEYEPQCFLCEKYFDADEEIYCDDKLRNGRHYHKKCFADN